MAGFQKIISDPQVSQAPNLSLDTGSTVGDIAKGASFVLDVFQQTKQKEKQSKANATLDRLIGMESELIAQGRSKFDINSRLLEEINQLPSAEERNQIRSALASFRGTTLVAEQSELTKTDEELRTENVEFQFGELRRINPQFALLHMEDNSLEEKERVVELWREQEIKTELALKEQQEAFKLADKNAVVAVDKFSTSMNTVISDTLFHGFTSLSKDLKSINPEDKEGIEALQITKRGIFESATLIKNQIERQYADMQKRLPVDGQSTQYLKVQKKALISQVENIEKLLKESSFDELKTFTNQLEALKVQYQLSDLEAGDVVAVTKAKYGDLFLNTISQRIITEDLELGQELTEGVATSLKGLTGKRSLEERINNAEKLRAGAEMSFNDASRAYKDWMRTLNNNNLSDIDDKLGGDIFKSITTYVGIAGRQPSLDGVDNLIRSIAGPKFKGLFDRQDESSKEAFKAITSDFLNRYVNDPKQGLIAQMEGFKNTGEFLVKEGRVMFKPSLVRRDVTGLSSSRGQELSQLLNNILSMGIISLEDLNLVKKQQEENIDK